ncbi:MAG TPA: hypothetical protein VLI04_13385 [Nocardioidaceae bacterium]|nr:hypothetical protein [Nocardioidaceae bacterium]
MSPAAKIVLGVIAVAVVLGILNVPFWAIALVIVGVPVAGYLMLDPNQRKRLKSNTRKSLGS